MNYQKEISPEWEKFKLKAESERHQRRLNWVAIACIAPLFVLAVFIAIIGSFQWHPHCRKSENNKQPCGSIPLLQ